MLGKEIRERIFPETAQNPFFFFFLFLQNEWFGGIYTKKVALRLLAHLVRSPATLLTLAVSTFSKFNFGHVFEGLSRIRLS